MNDLDIVIGGMAGAVIFLVLIGSLTGSLIGSVIHDRIRFRIRKRQSRRRHPSSTGTVVRSAGQDWYQVPTCGAVLAQSPAHTATCVLPAGHPWRMDHATTRAALEAVGYVQAPF